MNFGRFKLEDAHGGLLAHSLETPEGILRKGTLVDDRTHSLLHSAGYRKITIARLEPGDVTEDDAASTLGNLLLIPGLRRSSARRRNLAFWHAGRSRKSDLLWERWGMPAIVLPGCARSRALNGIDWVLDSLFAGESFGVSEIAAIGAGGLLKQTVYRPA